MNISNQIDKWSKKALQEAIDEGYDPSKEEFIQSDELEGHDDEDSKREYEEWMKKRNKVMDELSPKTTNEGCCDEVEETSDVESVPEDGECVDSQSDETKISNEEEQEQIEESKWGDIKRSWTNFWTKDIFKDKKQWDQVFNQLKNSAKDSLKKLAEALNAAIEDNKKDSIIKVNMNGTEKYLGNATIMDYKGQYIVFSIVSDEKLAATPSAMGAMMKEKNLQNLQKINGLLVVSTGDEGDKKQSDKKTLKMSGIPITSAKYQSGTIMVEVGKSMSDQKDDIDLKGMFTV